MMQAGAGTWIESTFCKRECIKFVPGSRDNARCCCGQLWQYHRDGSPATLRGPGGEEPQWTPSRHTHLLPTDAYGTIEFQGGPVPTKAQYIRLSHDTRPDLIIDLLTREWNLDLPKLLITVQGGKTNFELQPKLKKVIRKGLWKAAKTTGAWVFTGGTNTGVTHHVGEALVSESSVRIRGGGRVVSVGIAPWGIVERRQDLIGRNRDVPYHPINAPRSKFAALNSHHTYFLLVDNGTSGKYGAELILRRKLENYVSRQRIQTRGGLATPVVCVVIEGGPHTIRQVLEYVTDTPPVPVIVCDGTGRAADILAFVYKCVEDGRLSMQNSEVFDHVRGVVIATLEREFDLRTEQSEKLFIEVLQCCNRKELITVFRLKEGAELDQSILSALLHSHRLSDPEKLSLALTWNRVDIARSHVFNDDVEWPHGSLELAMMDALVHDRIEFVKLLLERGVTMTKFLTVQRLEDLYNAKQGPSNTLRYIIRDVKKNLPRDYRYTLIDIGLVINKLMGGAFRSIYTRRKFRNMYNNTMRANTPMKRSGSTYRPQQQQQQQNYNYLVASNSPLPVPPPQHAAYNTIASSTPMQQQNLLSDSNLLGVSSLMSRSLSVKGSSLGSPLEKHEHQRRGCSVDGRHNNTFDKFEYPFSELLVWSVLTKRQGLALLMWQHGEEALAKSLVAAKLYKALASEAADDDLETEVYEELRSYAKEFETLAVELLTFCYQQDYDRAHQLLTYELRNWSKQTCLSLAVTVNHRTFIAQPCCQILLADLWLGGLRTRKNTNLKVLLGLLFPPLITCLGFRSREELRTMPQTREDRWDEGGEATNPGGGGRHTDSDTASDTDEEHAAAGGDHADHEQVPLVNPSSNNTAATTATAATTGSKDASHLLQRTTLLPPLPPLSIYPRVGHPTPASSVFPFVPSNTGPAAVFGEDNGTVNNAFNDSSIDNKPSDDKDVRLSKPRRGSSVVSSRRDAVVVQNSTLLMDQSAFLEKKSKQLSAKVKFYEFYNAPIAKFWAHSIAYFVFLMFFTYTVLVELPDDPEWTEWYAIAYIITLMCEKIRLIVAKEPHKLKQKLEVWAKNRWNLSDSVCGVMFLVALPLRLHHEPLKSAGRIIYCTNIMYWYLKILEILSSHKYLGPLVMMMGEMIKNMAYFVVLLLVVLVSFGVCRQSILNPEEPAEWRLIREIFFQPYFMLYGEVFAGDIDPPCRYEEDLVKENSTLKEGEVICRPGKWVTPIAMSIYLLVANILLINLLIAVFNNIFTSINAMSQQVWKFQRFQVVMDFEERPVFPPPLIVFAHIHRTGKYLRRWWLGRPNLQDNGLKLFLAPDSLERVHDFEEECVYGYIRDKELKEQMTTEERVRVMTERSEVTVQRLEDIHTKFVATMTTLSAAEFRIKRLEEELSHTKDSYSVVHRFMVNYIDRRRSGSISPRSPYGSRPGSPSRFSGSTLRQMLEETQNNMLRKRYPSTAEQESDAGDEHESSEEENVATSTVEDTVRRRINAYPKDSIISRQQRQTQNKSSISIDPAEDEDTDGSSTLEGTMQYDPKSGHDDEGNEDSRRSRSDSRRTLSSRHTSESSSVAMTSMDRSLSGKASKRSNIRKISRGSRKSSLSNDKVFSPSRVSFMEDDETNYPSDNSDTDGRGRSGTVTSERHSVSDSHHHVQRSVSTPLDRSMKRDPLAYDDRSNSSSSGRPRIRVIPPSSPPPPIIKINTEYTSLADELENVVMSRLSPPITPHFKFGRIRHHSEGVGMTFRGFHNPLRDAEKTDFLIMEGLIQKRLHRNSENLAVSLEDLCSIHAENSDHEISVIQSQVQQNLDPGVLIAKSPTMYEMGSRNDQEFEMVSQFGNFDYSTQDRSRKLGHLGDLKKRHSIGTMDTSSYRVARQPHTIVPEAPLNAIIDRVEATQAKPDTGQLPRPVGPHMASPEPYYVDSPNSPEFLRTGPPHDLNFGSKVSSYSMAPPAYSATKHSVPQNLELPGCSDGLQPPRQVLASPVHSLMLVEQSAVPLLLTTTATSSHSTLFPPIPSITSPVMHRGMHVPVALQQQRQQHWQPPQNLPVYQQQVTHSPAVCSSPMETNNSLSFISSLPSSSSSFFRHPSPSSSMPTSTIWHMKSGGSSASDALVSNKKHSSNLTTEPVVSHVVTCSPASFLGQSRDVHQRTHRAGSIDSSFPSVPVPINVDDEETITKYSKTTSDNYQSYGITKHSEPGLGIEPSTEAPDRRRDTCQKSSAEPSNLTGNNKRRESSDSKSEENVERIPEAIVTRSVSESADNLIASKEQQLNSEEASDPSKLKPSSGSSKSLTETQC